MRQAIPKELVETVLQQIDLVEVIGQYVQLSRNGRYWKGLCPFHGEKSPSFTVTPEKKIFHCFGCKAGGNAIQFLMQIENWNFLEAVLALAERAGVPMGDLQDTGPADEHEQRREQIREAHTLARTFYHYLLNHTEEGGIAREYLEKRQFSRSMSEMFHIGYAPTRRDALVQLLTNKQFPLPLMEQAGLVMRTETGQWIDRFRDRLLFPITDPKGRPIGFGGRIMGEGQPKYLNTSDSPVFHKGKILYHLSEAKPAIRNSGEVVLFEGYVDVMRAWEAGVHNGVASLGTAFTEDHALLLKRLANRVTVCYDGDEAGQTAAEKAIPILQKHGFRIRIAQLPAGDDPDSYIISHGAERFQQMILAQATGVPAFQLQRLRNTFRMQEDEGKLAYVQAALTYLARLDMPAEREYYVNELSRQMKLSVSSLMEQMTPMLPSRPRMMGGESSSRATDRQMESKLPAYMRAEQQLLAAMVTDPELAQYVHDEIGEQFNLEIHAALAAYLYAYYAQGHPPDESRFLTFLDDPQLERFASGLMMKEHAPVRDVVLQDCIRLIRVEGPLLKRVEELTDQMQLMERAGDLAAATAILPQLMALKQQLQRTTRS